MGKNTSRWGLFDVSDVIKTHTFSGIYKVLPAHYRGFTDFFTAKIKGVTTINLHDSFKAYDVRGIVGETITAETVRATGAAFVDVLGLQGQTVLVGGDMRPSSPEFMDAFAQGATARGANVEKIGLISTDVLYFACGVENAAGVTFTASHNPAEYNGMKMAKAGAVPVSSETGLFDIRDQAQKYLDAGEIPSVEKVGTVTEKDILKPYAEYLRKLVDLSSIRPLKVVVDAGNGMGGMTTPAVLGDTILPGLPLEIVPLYFELDGTFPNHPANPLEPANLVDLQKAVVKHGADIGLAFDGDADRCFVIDEKGNAVTPSAVTALVAEREIARAKADGNAEPVIIYNLITSKAVPELVEKLGGRAVKTRVGHSFIKAVMAKENGVFGGEHSAHYYFKDFFNADTGMLAAMHVLAALGGGDEPSPRLARSTPRTLPPARLTPRLRIRLLLWTACVHTTLTLPWSLRTPTAPPSPTPKRVGGLTCVRRTPSLSCA